MEEIKEKKSAKIKWPVKQPIKRSSTYKSFFLQPPSDKQHYFIILLFSILVSSHWCISAKFSVVPPHLSIIFLVFGPYCYWLLTVQWIPENTLKSLIPTFCKWEIKFEDRHLESTVKRHFPHWSAQRCILNDSERHTEVLTEVHTLAPDTFLFEHIGFH